MAAKRATARRRAIARREAQEEALLLCLLEAFPSVPPKEVASAFVKAGGDPNITAYILFAGEGNPGSGHGGQYPIRAVAAQPPPTPLMFRKECLIRSSPKLSPPLSTDSYHDFEQAVDYILGMEECKQFDNFFQSKLNQSNANFKEILKSAKRIEHTKLSNSILQSLFKWEQLKVDSNASLERTFDDMKKSNGIGGEMGDSIVCTNNKMESGLKGYNGESEDYNYHREIANFLWRTMWRYFQKARIARSRKEGARACLLEREVRLFKNLATRVSWRACSILFQLQTVYSENNITIDLHSQYVGEAIDLLDLHWKYLTSFPSVDTLTIITGRGKHSVDGYPRLKVAVTYYLECKGIRWIQPNPGRFLIKLKSFKC